MKHEYTLCNVVAYDGSDAYVIKFILDRAAEKESRALVVEYCADGGMEVLKLDWLYSLSFENIVAMASEENYKTGVTTIEQFNAAVRFKEMYF